MAFQPQAAPKPAKKTGWSGGSKSEFDPRPTPKDFMMARMSAGQVAVQLVAVEVQASALPEGATPYSRTKELLNELYDEIKSAGNDSPRANFQPGQSAPASTTTSASTSAPAAAATSTPSAPAVTDVPAEVQALPNASVVPPLGKYSNQEGKENLNLATIFVQPAKRSHGVCWLTWFAGTDQKTERNIEFKNQVVEFLNAAETAGMLPDLKATCDD